MLLCVEQTAEDLMGAEKARWVAQHVTDREEIKRLNQTLFERNDASINNMKVRMRPHGAA